MKAFALPSRARLGAFARRRDGVSTVEFAIIIPVILLILAGLVDLGRALQGKFDLSSAISAASNYALLNGTKVNSTEGSALATQISLIAATSLKNNVGDIEVVINNGASMSYVNGAAKPSGTGANADKCYCPTRVKGAVVWGTAVTCAAACPTGGGIAGKYVVISASKPYTPMFSGYGIVDKDQIVVLSIVQAQ